jgi:hypothetical protein
MAHPFEEAGLLSPGGHPDALERVVQPDVGVQVAVIFMEMKERTGTPRERAALALPQLRKPAQFRQQLLQAIEITLRRMPHAPSMPPPARKHKSHLCVPPTNVTRGIIEEAGGGFGIGW